MWRPLTGGIAGFSVEWQHFDVLVVGASGQKLPTGTPRHTVNRTFMMFISLKAHHRGFTCTTERHKHTIVRSKIKTLDLKKEMLMINTFNKQ